MDLADLAKRLGATTLFSRLPREQLLTGFPVVGPLSRVRTLTLNLTLSCRTRSGIQEVRGSWIAGRSPQ